ncbi:MULTISPECIES: hypothetical protein [unclassified Rhizobium]|uniref:hypothetical protein n=1 Tax=unclassified Rhizobium TaxID=2613769 RepID=UPI000AE4A9A2|nr:MULTISPECIES: hypothetical protein [unclassified Rhizobium]RKD60816.1 hypothetical protein BJ928_108102 [Rhizobium sp. WW_1]
MKWNVISRLKTVLARRSSQREKTATQSVDRAGSAERELSARDYEMFYWCTAPAPWY